MPCDPNSLDVNPPPYTGPSFPGFSGFAPSYPDAPGMSLPAAPEDLLQLIQDLALLLPSGKLQANLNPNIDTGFLSVIVKLLDYFSVFLSIYKFVLPLLNIILCILEIICAIPNPFKLIKKIRRLFRVCIPDFLAMFPFLALIIMIITLILLIIALIEYIIAEVERIIAALLKNIQLLSKITSRRDSRSALVAIRKIGTLLCFLQNLFAVLSVIAALVQVIKDVLKLSFKIPPCDDSGSDGDGCCTPDVCPHFIRSGDFTNSTGTFQYLNQEGLDASAISGLPPAFLPIFAGLSAVRNESWQLWDPTLDTQHAFYNITKPYDVDPSLGFIFFPQGIVYDATTAPTKVPYTVDLRLFYTPATFGHTDVLGPRFIQIKDCIVQKTPAVSPLGWDNATISAVQNGVLNLVGGKVVEDDGTTPVLLNGVQANLETLIHLAVTSTPDGTLSNNPITFTQVQYTFKIVYETLVAEQLITLGCVPEVSIDKTLINTAFGANNTSVSIALQALTLPDPAAAGVCLATAMAHLRSNISIATLATFQATVNGCLGKLLSDSKSALGILVDSGISTNHSSFVLKPSVQFAGLPIVVTTTLNDGNGLNLCTKIPTDTAAGIAAKLDPVITFGQITPFTYDGSGAFTAELVSVDPGSGTIEMKYNNNFFSTVSAPADLTVPATITITKLDYQFIGGPGQSGQLGGGDQDGKARRDDSDGSHETGSQE